jgi:hypothetical protein
MEIKRTVLPPFGGPREESGANGSLWSMGGGIIGSPGAEDNRVAVPNVIGLSHQDAYEVILAAGLTYLVTGPEPVYFQTIFYQSPDAGTLVEPGSQVEIEVLELADATFNPTTVSYSVAGWSFGVQGDQIPPISVGDRVFAYGFYVIDENGNRTPNGSINVNGEWVIDSIVESNNGGQQFTLFSSAALRSEIGGLSTGNASSFGDGTIAIYDDVQVYNQAFDFTTGRLEATASADDGKVFIGLPNNDFKNSVLNEYPWLTSTSWQVRINSLSTTYPVSASLNASDLVLTPTAPMNSEFNSTITDDYWSISSVLVNSVTGVITINAYYT